jgi:predicted DNA-binding WGR domain protein
MSKPFSTLKNNMSKVKTSSTPTLKSYDVSKVKELNFFDLTGEKAKTNGSSNKSYHAELWVSKDGKESEIFTIYGPTGGTQNKDYRYYGDDVAAAEKEFDKIIKSKIKKGYQEIDVAQRNLGTDEAKQITKAVTLKNAQHLNITPSSLHQETQRLISTLMGATNQFVIQTLKCPLGQLTNGQIDLGRDILNKAKDALNAPKPSKAKLLELTNQFYGAIPHNLGSGARGQLTELILDSVQKIAAKEDDLDTLLDAKSIGAVLSSGSNIDDQYRSLNTDFKYIDKSSDLFNWINKMLVETKASNHHYLGKIKLLNAWGINRKNERDSFLNVISDLSKESKRINKTSLPNSIKDLIIIRPDIDDSCRFYADTNTWPLWHGTRTQNLTGILNKGILIRPAGAVITGAMYGNSVYYATQSTKSINYTSLSSSYWAKGNDKTAYMFIADVALGNPLIAKGPCQYTPTNIRPNHSVWAKGGQSGVINDEIMIYNTKQFNLRYLVEFSN